MGWWQSYKGWVSTNFRLMNRALSLTTSSFLAQAFILALQIIVGMLYLTVGLIVFFFALAVGIIRGKKQGGRGTNDNC
jgi:hypothetical protein